MKFIIKNNFKLIFLVGLFVLIILGWWLYPPAKKADKPVKKADKIISTNHLNVSADIENKTSVSNTLLKKETIFFDEKKLTSSLCQENHQLVDQREQKKKIEFSTKFPIKGAIPLPIGFKYRDIVPQEYRNNTAPRISEDKVKDLYLSCGKWLNQSIEDINNQKNYSFVQKDSFLLYKHQFSACLSYRQNVQQFYRKNREKLINGNFHNIEEHKRIIRLMKKANWTDIINEIEQGIIKKDHQLEWLPQIGAGKTLFQLAVIFSAPKYVFERFIELGINIKNTDINHAIYTSDIAGGLTLLKVLHKHGIDIFQEVFSSSSLGTTNLIEIIAKKPSSHQKLINFIKKIKYDPNLITVDTNDDLRDALYFYNKQRENEKDTSVIELLLEKGALVRQVHFALSEPGKLDNLLLKYKCD